MSEFEKAMLELEILKIRLTDAHKLSNNREAVEELLLTLKRIEDFYL